MSFTIGPSITSGGAFMGGLNAFLFDLVMTPFPFPIRTSNGEDEEDIFFRSRTALKVAMAANPGKETIGAHANCANALKRSIIPLELLLLLLLLLLFPVILLCVSKEVFCGDFCTLSPFGI